LDIVVMESSHDFEEHTGEIALTIRARTAAGLFAEAGRALGELMLGEPARGSTPTGPARKVEVRSSDRTALLVDWLNELIFLSDVHKAAFSVIDVTSISAEHISAEVRGVAVPVLKTAVKAATFHDAFVDVRDASARARIVLDV
jgi:SHS2 domain-containing protein